MRLRSKLDQTSARKVSGMAGTLLLAVILTVGACWFIQILYRSGQPTDIPSNVQLEITPAVVAAEASSTVVANTPTAGPGDVSPTTTANPQLPLLGRRIGLDPGHGPREDLGAVLVDPETGKLTLYEEELTLDLAMRTRDILVARGARVVLTRESADTFTGVPWPADVNDDGVEGSVSDDLQARIDILNAFDAEVFLSIHANGGVLDKSRREDVQVIYCGAPDCPYPVENKKVGRLVLDRLMAALASTGNTQFGGELIDDLDADSSDPPLHMFILGPVNEPRHVRDVNMPGVICESLYVTSPEHAVQLKKDDVRQAIALAYADGLQDYLTGGSE